MKCKLSDGHCVNVYVWKKNPKERRKLAAECVWPVDNERVTKSCQSHSRAQAIFTVCPTKNVSIFFNISSFYETPATLWARIAQYVKKPPLTVNVIDFEFFGFNVSICVPWSPLGPKKSWYIGRIIQIHKILGEKEGAFAPFHWNHYKAFPDFSDIWPSSE